MATILVADDDQLFRAIIRDQLERADYTVLEAGDGMAALDLAIEERPDALVLDVMMPLARGLEVVRRVRQQEGWYPAIVMISARTRVTDRLNALDAGADAYFEKPVEPDELLAAIDRLLTDVEPARYVDVLGPVWATLALERLAAEAIGRRSPEPGRTEQVEELFTDLVATSVGRMPIPGLPTGAAGVAMRLLWEDAIRALLRDSVEPVPVVTDVTLPDALAAVERAIGDETLRRHGARLGLSTTLADYWQSVLGDALSVRAPRLPSPGSATDDAWSRRLRQVLGHEAPAPEAVSRWRATLGRVLDATGTETTAVPTIDPLGPVWLAAATRPQTPARVR
jgi:two-component system, OmpR family, response regulator MprA